MFSANRKLFSPLGVEGTLPSSSTHRQMLAPQGVEGTLPSSSKHQVQVQQLHKGKENMLEESLNNEEERDFDLMEYDELEQHHIHHGKETISLEAQDEVTKRNIIIQEKEAQIKVFMENLVGAKYFITYLKQENK